MLTLSEFQISYIGLALGEHEYSYIIENSFFDYYKESDIKAGRVECDLLLEKKSDMLVLDFSFRGFVDAICDRCMGEYPQNISSKKRLIIKFGGKYQEQSDEIIIIPESQQDINVSQYIYEFIHLSLPVKRLHPGGTGDRMNCDKDVIEKLNNYKVSEKEKKDSTDPRWDKLRKLKFE